MRIAAALENEDWHEAIEHIFDFEGIYPTKNEYAIFERVLGNELTAYDIIVIDNAYKKFFLDVCGDWNSDHSSEVTICQYSK
jgi:hypothetical protein